MRRAWRLAINSISARRGRTSLLVTAVALSASLIVVVSTAIASINRATSARVAGALGNADLSLSARGTGLTFDTAFLDRLDELDEATAIEGRLETDLGLRVDLPVATERDGEWTTQTRPFRAPVLAIGLTDPTDLGLGPIDLAAGRLPSAPSEVVIDGLVIERLSLAYAESDGLRDLWDTADLGVLQRALADPVSFESVTDASSAARFNRDQLVRIGTVLRVPRFLRAPVELTVVGIANQPPLGGRPTVTMTAGTLQAITNKAQQLSVVEVVLAEGADADALAESLGPELSAESETDGGPPLILQTTAKVTSGLQEDVAASRLGLVLSTIIAFLSAAFIILTGLNVDLAERQRSLAVLRSIGATRSQLFAAQLFVGGLIGVLGALTGVPLGLGIAAGALALLREQVPTGLAVSTLGVALAGFGSIITGLIGAAWSAYRASTMSPLEGLANRAKPLSSGVVLGVLAAGLLGVATQLAIVSIPDDGQTVFWGYAIVGLPTMLIGYFLLGVPLTVVLARVAAPLVSAVLGLPRGLLGRHIGATPFRFGITAGALMGGLGLMIAIWTQGGSLLNDYLARIKFPDAFASGTNFSPESVERVAALPEISATSAIALYPIQTDAFGVRALQTYRSNFIAFDPEVFFELAELQWVEGDRETAIERLNEGGAIIVAREFQIAQGLGVGDTFRCRDGNDDGTGADSVTHEFEIVGVVTSPGLDIVSKFFDVGADFVDQAIHAVFGTRADLQERFGSDAIQMIQMNIAPDVSDARAIAAVRDALLADGLIAAGSGREIKAEIVRFATAGLLASSAIAVLSMVIACFGVANVIVAGIQQRRYEFGVLRAVGGGRGLIARLVVGEALIIAIAACVLGTFIGIQGAYAGTRMNLLLFGIELSLRPPPTAVLVGWGIVTVLTLVAALPAVIRATRRDPRSMLASRGI